MLKAEEVRVMNPAMERAMNALKFVAQHVKNEDKFESVSCDFGTLSICATKPRPISTCSSFRYGSILGLFDYHTNQA